MLYLEYCFNNFNVFSRFLFCPYNGVVQNLDMMRFAVVDDETNSSSIYSISDIIKLDVDVLGIERLADGILFVTIDELDLKLLSEIDESPKFCGKYDTLKQFLQSNFSNIEFHTTLANGDIFSCDSGYVIVLNMFAERVDRNGIFWTYDGVFFTLTALYKLIFRNNFPIPITIDINMFIKTSSGCIYKMDISKGIVRYRTKQKVLKNVSNN